MLVDFDISKTSWTKLRHIINKLFWHNSDFVLASYTFGCVKMSDFVPNNRHFREVLIFFFHSKKTAAEAHRELQKVYWDAALSESTCRDWFRRFKDGDFDVDNRPREGRPKTFEDTDVLYYELLTRTKPSLRNDIERNCCVWAEHCAKTGHNTTSDGQSYPTRRIPQILRRLIITCFGRWHMVWLISSSAHMKTSKNGLIRG